MLRKKILAGAVAAMLAGAAHAQAFRWVDKDGRVQFGDTPPAGVKATPLRAPPPPPTQPAGVSAGKSLNDQTQDFRKRQIEQKEAAEKSARAEQEAEARRRNCEAAQQSLRVVEAGRVARIDAKGERRFLDEKELVREAEEAQRQVKEWCN